MKKKILIPIFVGIIALCFTFSYFRYESPRYVKMADSLTAQTAKKLAKEKGLVLCGTGGGMIDDIKRMSMGFDYYKEVDLNSARQLLVGTVSEYLTAINNDEELRPFLHNYPFTSKNVEICIWIYKPDRKDLPPGKIAYLCARNGKLSYYAERPGENSPRNLVLQENYVEGLQSISKEE
jgi:hypothetical protein